MKKFIIYAVAAMTLSACNNNNDPENYSVLPDLKDDINISADIVNSAIAPSTRTSYTGSTAAWADTDAIGVYCTQSSPAASNLKFTYASSGSTWTPASMLYWANGTTLHTFLAYAPYATGTPVSTAVPLPALNTQTGALNPTQDFLISNNLGSTGITRSASPVALTFKHAFALIELDITINGSIASGTQLTNFTVAAGSGDKLYTSDATSTINLSTGAITLGTAAGATTNTVTATPASAPTLSSTATKLYLLVLPGTYTAPTLAMTLNENSSSLNIPAQTISTTVFASATKYTYAVSISRTGITISTPTINDWAAGTGGNVNVGI